MYHLQLEFPKRGDWSSTCKKNLKELRIYLSDQEIRNMTKKMFMDLVRKQCKIRAYEYLMNKRGKKGQNIQYKEIKMSEYLLPNEHLSIEDQQNIFEIRNNMTNIPSNFISEKENTTTCICGIKENMKHIYNCEYLNINKPTEKYEKIYEDNVKKMKNVLERFNENMKRREKLLEKVNCHEILDCDPLHYINVAMDK